MQRVFTWSAAWLLGVVLPCLLTGGATADELGAVATEARRAATRAREDGKTADAVGHLRVALGEHPTSPTLLTDLVRTTQADPDARALWSHALAAALSDGRGKYKLSKEQGGLLDAKDGSLALVAAGRARAVRDLAKAAGRLRGPGSYVLALAYYDLARILSQPAPASWQEHGDALKKAVLKQQPSAKEVVAALRRSAASLQGPDPAGARLVLGRALRGIATQARQKAPGTLAGAAEKLDATADTIIRAAEAELAADQMKPLTVAALSAMDDKAIAAFNAKHANIRRPGRAMTPDGRYLVVTPCGHGTLLATAEIADPTHDRLARWYGVDPFEGKPKGIIKVYPRFADLESESTPYWWANGFQRGAVTVLRFGPERKIHLARLLSHELAHRFDHLLFPGLPGWVVEGRAVWTGGAFASTMGGDFEPKFIDPEVGDVGPSTFGDPYWLKKYLSGDWDDYRDHYTAGHALWVYLATWLGKDGKPLFKPRLEAYLKEHGTGTKKPVALFQSHFADGQAGRPADMDAFAKGFGDFLRGWRVYEPPPWMARYVEAVGDDSRSPYVFDGPNWSTERRREEPVFGQDHPARAARVLAEGGQPKPAIGLLEWSLAVDDFEVERARFLAQLLETEGRKEAAAALRAQLSGAEAPATFLPPKHAALQLAETLRTTAEGYAERGLRHAAHVFRTRHRTLSTRLGISPPAGPGDGSATRSALYPVCSPALRMAEEFFREDRLSGGYDKWRDKDAWRVTANGDLVVGHVKEGTGGDLTVAGSPWTFVRSDRRLAGRYTLSGRIALLSPHVDAAIVLGYTRRDRNVQVRFEVGEWGEEDRALGSDEALDQVIWHVTGLRYRDVPLPRAEGVGVTKLKKTRNEFHYEIRVDGAAVEVLIEGKHVATFADGAGQPVAGYAGFAVKHGAIRVEQPRVTYHVVGGGCAHGFPLDHDPAAPTRDIDRWILGRRIRGAPHSPRGTLLLWFPLPYVPDDPTELETRIDDARVDMRSAALTCKKLGCTPTIVVYLPRRWPEKAREAFAALAKEIWGKDVIVREHGEGTGAAKDVDPGDYGYSLYVLFQDPVGVTRFLGRGSIDSSDEGLVRWMKVLRGW